MKSELIVTPATELYPLLAQCIIGPDSGIVVMFENDSYGTVVVGNDNSPLGTYGERVGLNDKSIWRILPTGSSVTLIQT